MKKKAKDSKTSILESEASIMMKRQSGTTIGVTLAIVLAAAEARASSHREALGILNDPCVDNTDVYAWVTPTTHDTLYLIAGYNGLHEPGQGNQQTRLCDDVRYEFHIVRGNGDLLDNITYEVTFSSTPPTPVDTTNLALPPGGGKELLIQLSGVQQTYEVRKRIDRGRPTLIGSGLTVAPPNVGPRTDRVAYGLGPFDPTNATHSTVGLYDDAFAATFIHDLDNGEGRVWVGTRDDAFYLDEKGIFDIINVAPCLPDAGGVCTLAPRGTAKDVFAGFNLNVIAFEIPTTKLTANGGPVPHNGTPGNDTLLGIWVSEARRKTRILFADGTNQNFGPWVQVGRQGLPLVNAGLIGTQDQGKYLRSHPFADVANFGAYFLNPILVRDVEFVGIYAALGVPDATVQALKSGRTDILDAINLTNHPTAGAHNVMIAPGRTGDVLRVDMAIDSQFPNGRSIPGGAQPNMEQVDVSDVLLTVILSGGAIALDDGVFYNDKNYHTEFPWLALPHQGLFEGHGAGTP
jgi:hypothetical protein